MHESTCLPVIPADDDVAPPEVADNETPSPPAVPVAAAVDAAECEPE